MVIKNIRHQRCKKVDEIGGYRPQRWLYVSYFCVTMMQLKEDLNEEKILGGQWGGGGHCILS